MLDSITERDRGYNYQDVIGDLAQIADLVLVLFDPHKAGTVREAHTSLRDTLPAKTFEDRVLYVLNRIDECASMTDLLRVYGTLCWNLSQITGRKDIPMIHLTYSTVAAEKTGRSDDPQAAYLHYLENQREDLKKAVLQAPCHRLDNLASFVETHGERLCHFLEAMISYRKKARLFLVKSFFAGLAVSLVGGAAGWVGLMGLPPFTGLDPVLQITGAGLLGTIVLIFWLALIQKYLYSRFLKKWLRQLDNLTPLPNQTRRDSWASVRDLLYVNLKNSNGRYSLSRVLSEHATVKQIHDRGSREIREALKELAGITMDDEPWTGKGAGPVPYWANAEAPLDGQ
jgi:EH domain-containing protein 1